MAPNGIRGRIQERLDKCDGATPSQQLVDERVTAAGHERNADGKWPKDGEVLEVPMYGPAARRPIERPMEYTSPA